MPEDDKTKNQDGSGKTTGDNGKEGVKEVNIKIDTKNMESVLERLAKVEAENKKLEDEAKKSFDEKQKLIDEKKKLEDDKKKLETSFEEEKTTKEDYESKLKVIGEQKLAEKRKIIMDKAKEVIKDETRLKAIEDGIKDPESLKATESLVETFYNVLKQGEKEHAEQMETEKKEMEKKLTDKEGGKGNVPMNKDMVSKEQGGANGKVGYETQKAMIRDLRKKSHSDNPEEAAYAKSVLEEMFTKWAGWVKKNYEGKAQGLGEIGPEDIDKQPSLREITKKGGEAV